MDINLKQFADDLLKLAIKTGADEADIYIQSGRESEVSTRMRDLQSIKEANSRGYGLRVFKDKKLGFYFSSDFTRTGMRKAAEKAIKLAGESSADEHNGLPEPIPEIALPDLDLYDSEISKIPTRWKIDACRNMEQRMFDYDKRVFNSEGAGFYDGDTFTVFTNSHGQRQLFKSSYCYLICQPVARQDGKLQAGWWFSHRRHFSELDSPAEVAVIAAERAVRMLGAKTPGTAKVPVVFDNITGAMLLGSIIEAVNGKAVFRESSYLAGRLDSMVASSLVSIIDDGILRRGLASSPFDGEGRPTARRKIISEGRLTSYMYDTHTARRSNTESTANAQRSYSSLPSIGPYNFYLQQGKHDFDEIIGSVKSGLYLLNLMGQGANPVTGDLSLGASGIWIENGELAYPVEGITVASNMLTILKNIDMIGSDLKLLGQVSSPTFRVAEMTVSGR